MTDSNLLTDRDAVERLEQSLENLQHYVEKALADARGALSSSKPAAFLIHFSGTGPLESSMMGVQRAIGSVEFARDARRAAELAEIEAERPD